MLTALSTALSALTAQSTAIDVVGNNLANLNTTGYKASSTEFYDLVSQTMGEGGSTQIGLGVGTPLTKRNFVNGQIQGTSGPLDLAIQGSGFLIVKDASGGTQYTRAGDLKTDKTGNLMDSTGSYVQGWTASNGVVNTSSPIGDLFVPIGSLKAPVATQNMRLTANLDSRSAAVSGTQDATNTSFSTGVELYDSLGNSHVATMNFWNNGGNSWNWQATVPGTEVTPASATPVQIGSGTLTFNTDGTLATPLVTDPAPQLTIAGLADGASNMTVNLNLFDGTTPALTQFGQTSGSAAQFQDGAPSAQLSKVGIGNGGTVVATYSDGQTVTMGQIAMANFVNPDSLIAVGNNAFQTSGASSLASIGLPNSGGRGQILGSSLESSTVDIATEFTNLMVGQRSYQANAKVVTAADQINQVTIDLIR
jgi:flagellar hook protein FlgE